jgi:hypothetical protein
MKLLQVRAHLDTALNRSPDILVRSDFRLAADKNVRAPVVVPRCACKYASNVLTLSFCFRKVSLFP